MYFLQGGLGVKGIIKFPDRIWISVFWELIRGVVSALFLTMDKCLGPKGWYSKATEHGKTCVFDAALTYSPTWYSKQ